MGRSGPRVNATACRNPLDARGHVISTPSRWAREHSIGAEDTVDGRLVYNAT